MSSPLGPEESIAVTELDDGFPSLRLREAGELELLRRSLERYGQLQAIVAFREEGRLRVLDGLKRLQVARGLGWAELRTSVAEVSSVGAKVWLFELHRGHGLSELEEAWLVRALHRDDGLTQGAIAHCLGRNKSWVCRRLLLVEGLDEAVQADVRLGLLAPRTAVALTSLPRGNGRQAEAAAVVVRRGMTVRQTERMVAELSEARTPEEWSRRLTQWCESGSGGSEPARVKPPTVLSEAEAIHNDVTTLLRVSARLQARLLQGPLSIWGTERGSTLQRALEELLPVLEALSRTVTTSIQGARSPFPSEEDP